MLTAMYPLHLQAAVACIMYHGNDQALYKRPASAIPLHVLTSKELARVRNSMVPPKSSGTLNSSFPPPVPGQQVRCGRCGHVSEARMGDIA